MFRLLEGVVAGRLLLHYRVDPALAGRLVEPPLVPRLRAGAAVAGVSLLRLSELGPLGLPSLGLTLATVVHWLAVAGPVSQMRSPGFLILRRDTDSRLVAALGRPLFRDRHHLARVEVEEDARRLQVSTKTAGASADLLAEVEFGAAFQPAASFPSLADAERFFLGLEDGLAEADRGSVLQAVRIQRQPRRFEPVRLQQAEAAFFARDPRLAGGGAVLDGALAMRSLASVYAEARPAIPVAEGQRLQGAQGLS